MTKKYIVERSPKVKFLEPAAAKDLVKPKRRRRTAAQLYSVYSKKARKILKAILPKKPVTQPAVKWTKGTAYRQYLAYQEQQLQAELERRRKEVAIARQQARQQQKLREDLRQRLLRKPPEPVQKTLEPPSQHPCQREGGYGFCGYYNPEQPPIQLPACVAACLQQTNDSDCCSSAEGPW